jgi:hypothetical protein
MGREIRQANELCQGKKEFPFETLETVIRAHDDEKPPKEIYRFTGDSSAVSAVSTLPRANIPGLSISIHNRL